MALSAAIGVACAFVACQLAHPQSAVFHRIVDIAAWLRGAAKPEVVTWPAWGYAWVVAWAPSFDWIIFLQASLGVLALAALARRLRLSMPRQAVLISILCVLAVPWHDMQVTLYPSAMAGSLMLLALLSLDSAFTKADFKRALLAGILMGLAQNFRTEFVLLPVFIGICVYQLKRWDIVEVASLKPIWIFMAVALIFQLPWAYFYHANAGRYSLTESNFGHVMYVSLGSQSHNPWGIEGNDEAALQAVRDEGYLFSSLSEQGNQVLRRLVFEKVRQHPYGLVGRTLQQLRNSLLAPFSWGEPKLDKPAARDLDVLRQELKARLGVGINVAKLSDYRRKNLYSHAKQNGAVAFALGYQIATVGFGCLVLLLGILGVVLTLVRRALRPTSLLLWLLSFAALYKLLQDVLLAYQVSYLNNVYPAFIPFAAISVTAIFDWLRAALHIGRRWVDVPR